MATRMPVLFFGHGNPLNALADNAYTRAWAAIGASVPHPRAILAISAHWYEPRLAVTAMPEPRTIHDFGGFPRALYDVRYPAPGDPALAVRVRELLEPARVEMDTQWGLDHGTWSVLCHVYPNAEVPIVQLSIDETLAPAEHFELAQRLHPLRDEGVLIVASGNLIHNLHAYAWGQHSVEPFAWALRFEQYARAKLVARDFAALVDYESLGEDAILSAPTPDHYLPLVYAMGAADASDKVTFPIDGIDGGSISMLSIRFG